jgi:hypothetical protein
VARRIKSVRNLKDPFGNQAHNLSACSAVPEPTVLPHTPASNVLCYIPISTAILTEHNYLLGSSLAASY